MSQPPQALSRPHPDAVAIRIDPERDFDVLCRMMAQASRIKLLGTDKSVPGVWTIWIISTANRWQDDDENQ